jgi:catechol 2,3-dioxygenase-like lactoylglutathione lyase family enzyme
MNASLNQIGAITLFVEDVRRSREFYERVFRLPVIHEDDESVVFEFSNTILNLLNTDAAHELIEPATVGDRDAGAQLQLTIWVDDSDAACAELVSRGVELLNGPIDREWGVRTACFADPDGHIWEVAQPLSGAGSPTQ